MKPLAVLEWEHARFELWPGHVRTVFADGKEVAAAPNEGETIIETACHEALHSIVQAAMTGEPSHCLRMVAEGQKPEWTPERRQEEALAYGMTYKVAELVRAMGKAYGGTQEREA